MKVLNFALVLATICLASCGGKKNSEESSTEESEKFVLKPAETVVSGDMEGCFMVVDKEYKLKGDFNKIITVEIKRTKEDLPFDLDGRELWSFSEMGSAANVKVGFGIEFLDADGDVVDKISANSSGLSGPYDPKECVSIVKLKPGKKGTIRFSIDNDAKDVLSFRITSAYEENEESSSSGIYSDNDEDSDDDVYDDHNIDDSQSHASTSGSADWNSILDSYDSYVSKYISFLKKGGLNNMDAISEYPDLMEKLQDLSEKISNAQDEMSASQWARYMRITNKMLTAAQ